MADFINSKARLIIFAVIIILLLIQTKNSFQDEHYKQCNYDYLLDKTSHLNKFFRENKLERSILMFTSTQLIDL